MGRIVVGPNAPAANRLARCIDVEAYMREEIIDGMKSQL